MSVTESLAGVAFQTIDEDVVLGAAAHVSGHDVRIDIHHLSVGRYRDRTQPAVQRPARWRPRRPSAVT
jgi:hypothetical protein